MSWRTAWGLAVLLALVLVLAACELGDTAEAPTVASETAAAAASPLKTGSQAAATVAPTSVAAAQATAVASPATSPVASALGRQALSVPELVKRVRLSVVHIATEAIAIDVFGGTAPSEGVGTGFIIGSDGTIVTNNHVVSGARRVVVTLFDGRTYEAEIVGLDAQTDLAVLRIPENGLEPVALGSSTALEVGESVIAIGHALDLPGGPTVTTGVVSAKDRALTDVGTAGLTLSELIQTDASINPGNSGGPLVNLYGEVVGISSAAAGSAQGIGFAIAIDAARPVIETLIAEGRIERGFLGVQAATITRSIARQNRLPVEAGIYLVGVVPNSPAEMAGLLPNDILVAINDEPVLDAGALSRVLAKYPPGTEVTVSVLRAGEPEPLALEVTLGTKPTR